MRFTRLLSVAALLLSVAAATYGCLFNPAGFSVAKEGLGSHATDDREGMQRVAFLLGSWDVQLYSFNEETHTWETNGCAHVVTKSSGGGLMQISTLTGEIPRGDGWASPYTGAWVLTYNASQLCYQGTWVDGIASATNYTSGTLSTVGNICTLTLVPTEANGSTVQILHTSDSLTMYFGQRDDTTWLSRFVFTQAADSQATLH